ncbi:MAG TPA: hypothetical protein VEQ63_06705 [Bryobacteraceae bacterium]|nr:hypothetical protein [Bryobacteraceae bacterium]
MSTLLQLRVRRDNSGTGMRRLRLLLLCGAAAATLSADVTIRYSYELKPGPMVPPAVAEKMRAPMETLLPASGLKMQVKGNRAYSNMPGMTSISDFDGAMITIIDPKNKKYATAESVEYIRSLADVHNSARKPMPAAEQMMAQMKTSTSVRKTGKARIIHGIPATETEFTLTIEMPGTSPRSMRSVFSIWVPGQGEVERHPALREMLFFTQRAYEGTDPIAATQKVIGNGSGLFSGMSRLIGELRDSGVVLEMRISTYALGRAETVTSTGGKDAAVPASDAPLMEVVMRLEELSTAEVPASAFDIPREYAVVTMNEILRGVLLYTTFR